MEKAILEFIDTEVKSGQYFDSHTLIKYLIQKHTDLYLQGAGGKQRADTYHGQLAQKLSVLEKDGVLEKIGDKVSVSKNIKDKFSECALWRKK